VIELDSVPADTESADLHVLGSIRLTRTRPFMIDQKLPDALPPRRETQAVLMQKSRREGGIGWSSGKAIRFGRRNRHDPASKSCLLEDGGSCRFRRPNLIAL